jgi:hypothetical protein
MSKLHLETVSMHQSIENLKSTTFGGRRFTRKQIVEIKSTVCNFTKLSRRELANTVCEHLGWFTPTGENRSQACLNALEQMEAANLFALPTKIEFTVKRNRKPIAHTKYTDEQATINDKLESLLPIQLIPVVEPDERKLWNEYVDRYHYLGYKQPIGAHLRYFVVDNQGRKLGGLLFSFASKKLPDRDFWIGWDDKARQKRLDLVVNNNRFLIFPWVEVKNLASKTISIVSQQLADDWNIHHGYRPLLIETFVDTTKYKGTCYQAANWINVGETDGAHTDKNGDKKTVKAIYVYPLAKHCKSKLISGEPEKKKRKPTIPKPINYEDDAPFVNCWRQIISTIGEVCDEFDLKWRKRKRTINTLLLVLFIFKLVFSKNKQGYKITINELWEQCKLLDVELPQHTPVAASAFCKARLKLDENIFKCLNTKIIESYKELGDDKSWHGHRVFAVDGTKINLPRQLLQYGYKLPHEKSHYPFGLVSCLYQLRTKLPIDFDLRPNTGERTFALEHLNKLTKGDVVVYDRGYFSYAMLYWHLKKGIHPVFRMPYQTYPAITQFIDSAKTDEIIEIQLTRERFTKIRRKDPLIDTQSLKIRLIKYQVGDELYTLGTTLCDKKYSDINEFSNLYHERWDIEELYKISKVLIEVQDFHAQTERGVKQELYAHFVMITLSRIFSNHIEDDIQKAECNKSENSIRVNMKNCLITVSRNLEILFIQQNMLLKKCISNITNSIRSCTQKVRPNRSYERRSKKPYGKWQTANKLKRRDVVKAT